MKWRPRKPKALTLYSPAPSLPLPFSLLSRAHVLFSLPIVPIRNRRGLTLCAFSTLLQRVAMAESTGGTGFSDSWQLFWGCRQQHSSFLAFPLHFVLLSEAKHTNLSKEREFFELRSRRSLFSLGRLISRASSIFCCLLRKFCTH